MKQVRREDCLVCQFLYGDGPLQVPEAILIHPGSLVAVPENLKTKPQANKQYFRNPGSKPENEITHWFLVPVS